MNKLVKLLSLPCFIIGRRIYLRTIRLVYFFCALTAEVLLWTYPPMMQDLYEERVNEVIVKILNTLYLLHLSFKHKLNTTLVA